VVFDHIKRGKPQGFVFDHGILAECPVIDSEV